MGYISLIPTGSPVLLFVPAHPSTSSQPPSHLLHHILTTPRSSSSDPHTRTHNHIMSTHTISTDHVEQSDSDAPDAVGNAIRDMARAVMCPNPLSKYDLWTPSNNNGPVPFVDNARPGPSWVTPEPFDPAKYPLDGKYLGSRKMRSSEDPVVVAVRDLLDLDACRIGRKVWFRETNYMWNGIITLGWAGECRIIIIFTTTGLNTK